MSLTASEIESLRFHLGWGNIAVAAYPYTPDGFYEVFSQVVSPYLSTAAETDATTAITAGSSAAVTPTSMTDIVVGAQLIVDVGEASELVMVRSVTATTFTAAFVNAHPATGYLVALMCGKARLRYLMWVADRMWAKLQSTEIGGTLGIKQLGRGEIEWFSPNAVYQGQLSQYLGAVGEISLITRVPMNPETRGRPGGRGGQLEVY